MEQVIGQWTRIMALLRRCDESSVFNWIFFFAFPAHINHIKDVAGEDHVGLGAGYDGINQ